jgi:hypothetical protein
MQFSRETPSLAQTIYTPNGMRSSVSVTVREIRDVEVGMFPRRLFVRVWLDTSFQLRMNEETEFATNVVTFRRKSRGPQRFCLESGQCNAFTLPDFVIVCDICEMRHGFCCTETSEVVSRVRIPLSRIKFDTSGRSELWYSFHYPLKKGRARAGRFAGRILVAIQYDVDTVRDTVTTGALSPRSRAVTPSPQLAYPCDASALWTAMENGKWVPPGPALVGDPRGAPGTDGPLALHPTWATSVNPNGSTVSQPLGLMDGPKHRPISTLTS